MQRNLCSKNTGFLVSIIFLPSNSFGSWILDCDVDRDAGLAAGEGIIGLENNGKSG
jgi:hypothetical protein